VHFGHPLLLLTLLVLPVAALGWRLLERRRARYAVRFTNLDVLASVAGSGRSWRRYPAPILVALAVAALCTAVARPSVSTMVERDNATVILVVDCSGSMQATDVKPSRLAAAQAAVRTFLDRAPKKLKVGIVAFAGEPQVVAPPTTDRTLLREAVDTLGFFPGFGGTAIGDALAAAVELGQQSIGVTPGAQTIAYVRSAAPAPQHKGPLSILFLSDGKQTRGQLQPLEGAQKAKDAGAPVDTIALGTPNGVLQRDFGGFGFGNGGSGGGGGFGGGIPVPPDPATLRAIAQLTGGQFFAARSARALSSAYQHLGESLGREPGRSEVAWKLAGLAALFLVAAGILSALWAPRLP
jgi:Ca-activated chloride channel family protein